MVDPSLDAALTAAVEERFEREQVAFLAELVSQPSCTREPEDVEAAARLVDARAHALGLTQHTHVDPDGHWAPHRVYETPAVGARTRCLALIGHVDTVFPRAMGFLGFERDEDVARGPGVLDMKSGLSAMLFALDAVRSTAPDFFAELPVRVIVVSDEEVGSPSSSRLYAKLAPLISEALVFECGRAEDGIVTSRKGGGRYVIEATGRGAHAGLSHDEGVNAIAALAHVIEPIEALTDYARGVTLNVGLIAGGTSTNTVPERARLEVDGRVIDPAHAVEIDAKIREIVARPGLPARLADARLTVEGGFHRPPMVATDANRALMRRYAAQAEAVGLGAPEAPLQGGGSDANLLAAAGVPCIDGLGPWGQGAHRTSEWCSLDSLRRRTEALARFLARTSAVTDEP